MQEDPIKDSEHFDVTGRELGKQMNEQTVNRLKINKRSVESK
jgi:hypothetical protein